MNERDDGDISLSSPDRIDSRLRQRDRMVLFYTSNVLGRDVTIYAGKDKVQSASLEEGADRFFFLI